MEHRNVRSSETSNEESPISPRYRFTPEELRVMKECNRESFYYRSLPIATLGMAAAHVATKKGYLKASPRWGSTFKVIGAGFAGWLLGKLSYRSTCEEKFLRMTDSRLADMLRRRRGMVTGEGVDSKFPDSSGLPVDRKGESDSYSSSSSGALNLDSHLNIQHEGLDDTHRPSLDRNVPTTGSADAGGSKQQTTYEELRQKNRDDYDRRHYVSPPSSYQFTPVQPREPEPEITPRRPERPPSAGTGAKTKYGDAWE